MILTHTSDTHDNDLYGLAIRMIPLPASAIPTTLTYTSHTHDIPAIPMTLIHTSYTHDTYPHQRYP